MKIVEIFRAAVRGENESACAVMRRRIAGMRRVALVGFVIWLGWEFAEATHIDAVHEGCKAGVDGVVAFIIERLCGSAE
ncbi:hypothetical protein [Paraburkholderia bannensis]|uniref:hypothetical protein n=1 Tax=Paraburkholderia bannensis TaxID=765414 RepID=UPI002AC32552|nr:hypothetical protein [Paraburkholderia bannensis]